MRLPLMSALAIALAGCLGVTPEEARYRELERRPGFDDDGDEEHAPGTPCLDCHGRDFNPGEKVFALAGTVYLRATDPDGAGLPGVNVFVRDARGRDMPVVTNGAGNFMFEVRERDDERIEVRGEGKTRLSFWPEYPLRAWIESGGVERRMETPIRREGSCATCHDREPSATSVGRIFLMEAP